jgi:hypothetical protein
MTLQEKFKKEGFSNCEYLEQVADEFAIEFTDWCEDNYFPSSGRSLWFDTPNFDIGKKFTTRELLEIYKKGL